MKKIILILILFYSSNTLSSTLVVNKVFPATVLITAEDKNGQPQSLGSGFLVAPNIIATNFHVIENSYSGYVKFINKKEIYEIEGVVGYNENYDLALIKISNNNANPLPLISPSVDIGQKIFAIGNPLGLEGTISDGIISGLREFQDFSVLQISAPISPGNSGGPVVNENGDVVGVATFTMTEGQNINFAVPVKYLKELLENQTSEVSLSSLVKIKTNYENESIKDFRGVSFTKFRLSHYHGKWTLDFSIKNNLRKEISNIKTLWIIYDKDGEPVDYKSAYYFTNSSIKAKLASRTSVTLPSDAMHYIWSNGTLSKEKDGNGLYLKFWDAVELRILDYQIEE